MLRLFALFSEKGYRVAFTYCSSEKEAQELSDKYGAEKFKVDFEDVDSVVDFSKELLSSFGEIDVLINNAGVSH